jgi:hypothetical protein
MKRHSYAGLFLLTVSIGVFSLGVPVSAAGMNLVDLLTKNLSVTNSQAQGGAGAIFKAASQKMSVADFAKVTAAMPEVNSLMDAAPAAEKDSGALGGLSSMLGKKGSGWASLTGVSGAFSKLGLGSDMVGKFIPIILEYAKAKGGDGVFSLLKSALY